jgi:glycosyltransferase involved in cell wall biosynthesis
MNILFLTRRFYPDIGGVEKHAFEIGKRLVQKGHSVSVVAELQTDKNLSQKPANIDGMTVYRINVGGDNWFKKFRIWKNLWSLKKIIQNSDVIHCHDVFFWYLPFRFLYPKKPVYTTFHGYESYPIKKSAIIIRKISEKLSWGNICIGDFIKKWYGTRPTFVSYGAVETSSFKLQVSNFKKESAIFIGRLDDDTGISTYIKAFEILKTKYPKFELLVIGDGKHRKLVEKKVKVLGFKENSEKYFLKYHFAFVSGYLSILEAFAAKKLIFAVYDNPLKQDYLKLSPFSKSIVIVENEKILAEKIKYYLDHPKEGNNLVNNSYNWVKNQTWEKLTNTYLQLWKTFK